MNHILLIAQVIVATLLIILILLQQRGSGLGQAFGGGGGESYGIRRGMEKKIFWATVFFGTIFIILALLNLII
ncbi:MAG: preprotein translocase subunit SecG [Patescibacteria group bacterium]|nr:preprotein translocase subunit SecG [Patescibacteria group bacterium]